MSTRSMVPPTVTVSPSPVSTFSVGASLPSFSSVCSGTNRLWDSSSSKWRMSFCAEAPMRPSRYLWRLVSSSMPPRFSPAYSSISRSISSRSSPSVQPARVFGGCENTFSSR